MASAYLVGMRMFLREEFYYLSKNRRDFGEEEVVRGASGRRL